MAKDLKQARKTLKEHQLMTLRRQAKLKICSSKGGGSEFKRITNSGLMNLVAEDPLNPKAYEGDMLASVTQVIRQ